MPMTFPPSPVDGFIIAGGPDADNTGFTYPSNLERELKENLGYKSSLADDFFRLQKNDVKLANKIIEFIKYRFEIAKYLNRHYPVHCLQITTFFLNTFHHMLYDGDLTKQAWKAVDNAIGSLMHEFEYVFMLSDHGTSKMKKITFIDAWLKQKGYLSIRKHPIDILPACGINRTNIANLLNKVNLGNLTKYFNFKLLKKIAGYLPSSAGTFGVLGINSILQRVNWKKTAVLGLPQGPIYINRDIVKGKEEYENLRDELSESLMKICDPDNGKRIFEKIYKPEELYKGPYVSQAPDLIALDADEYHNRGGIFKDSIIGPKGWKGNNRLRGMFVICGPGIIKGLKSKARIVDLTPTLLHILNIPIPEDIDGGVLRSIFEKETDLYKKELVFQNSLFREHAKEEFDTSDLEISKKLETLGYL
jgi:predicted AlkP superfamily phosphohydrolase/phosphomutase